MTQLVGTGRLVRLALRRDRLVIPVWLLAVVGTVASTISAFAGLYPDVLSRNRFAVGIQGNVTFRAFYGPLFSGATNGGLTAWRITVVVGVMLGLMSIFLITRHTRQDEESGRLELLAAGVVGRSAPLAGALTVAAAANALAAGLIVAVLATHGEDVAGALAVGLSLGFTGLVFAAVAAVSAQLMATARAANGVAVAALGLAFVLRATGDGSASGPKWLTWLSPLGWAEQVRAFDANRFWVLVLPLAGATLLVIAATLLNTRRDLGGSLWRTRPGPARAARRLTGPLAVSWRQQRAGLLGWAAAFAVLGWVFGSLSSSVGDMADSSPQIADILRRLGGAGALLDAYFAGVLGILGLIAAGYGVSAMLRLRSDEGNALVEPLLAAGVRRGRLLAAQAVFVFGGPALLLLVAGVSAGVGATSAGGSFAAVLGGAAALLPAVWVVGAVATLLFGPLPRWSAAAWGALAACALISELGPTLSLPQALLDVSPFSHVGRIAADWLAPSAVLTLLAAALFAVGWAGFRRRDIG